MRKDTGVDGDAQRLTQLVWMFFLKIFDDKEQEFALLDRDYRSPLSKKYQWRTWAADAEGLTGPTGDHLPTVAGARRWREAARREQDDDLAAEQYAHAVERLAEDGWRGYEISNWARPGHESRHNLAYWRRQPYEAVGPGAHAFDGAVRRWNAARLDA